MVARRRRVGADQGQAHIRPVPVGDPRLLPIDDPAAVILSNAPAAYGGDVAAGIRLAEQLAPHMLAAPHRRQQHGFLFLGTEMQQHMCCQVDLIDGARGAGAQDLLTHDAIVQRMVVGPAAVLHGPVSADETGGEQGGEARAQQCFLLGALGSTVSLTCQNRGSVVGDEGAHPLPKSGQLELAGAGGDSPHHPDTCASSARLDRAVPSSWALVNTRRSWWCSGYSQVKPIPPDSCMHSSTAAVAFAATKAWATAVSAVTRSSSAAAARAAFMTTARALTSNTSSSTKRCCTA